MENASGRKEEGGRGRGATEKERGRVEKEEERKGAQANSVAHNALMQSSNINLQNYEMKKKKEERIIKKKKE